MKPGKFALSPCLLLFWIIARPGTALALSSGPQNGVAGDPPAYHDCTICHDTHPVNSGDGTLSLLGLPLSYVPDSTYFITIRLEDPGQHRWGFEMTVIDAAGNRAGILSSVNPLFTQVSAGAGSARDYAKHTLSGTQAGRPFGTWDLNWKAPTAGGTQAHFYLAGNAANWDGFTTGDYIYTMNVAIPEAPRTSVDPGGAVATLRTIPNPITDRGLVEYSLPSPGPVELVVVDARGRLVRGLMHGVLGAGNYATWWDGHDGSEKSVASGIYYVRLSSASGNTTERVVLIH